MGKYYRLLLLLLLLRWAKHKPIVGDSCSRHYAHNLTAPYPQRCEIHGVAMAGLQRELDPCGIHVGMVCRDGLDDDWA